MPAATQKKKGRARDVGSGQMGPRAVQKPLIRDERRFLFTPPERTTLAQQVADHIETLVLAQEPEPRIRLPSERALEQQLGVSRIVIREAMKQLAERGLVHIESGRGTFVVPVTPKVMSKSFALFLRQNRISYAALFQLRRLLEGEIAALAARGATASSIAELHRNVSQMALVARNIDEGHVDRVEEFARRDFEFHQLLARTTGNPLLEFILQPVAEPLLQVRRIGALVPGAARKAKEQHARILKAVESRREERARAEMLAHLHYVEKLLQQKNEHRWDPGH
ncbi:MAG: FCD domain-containing protein [Luteitalea sp.]|nr:FCD domain-containing protein [Luteitalea sp.]